MIDLGRAWVYILGLFGQLVVIMNAALLLVFCGIILLIAYFVYGSYLERAWGVDEKRATPAHTLRDDRDYSPASKMVLFGHQFASIAGAGPINGPIIAAMFGWLPVVLWIVLGSIFMGAVQDFAALYASVRNGGKSAGVLIEHYVGKSGKIYFLIFSWLMCILVIAAFGDVVAMTFNGITSEGLNAAGGMASSCSVFFIFFAVILGFILRRFPLSSWKQCLIAILFLIAGLCCGMYMPLYLHAQSWLCLIFGYIFIASILPMWTLLQPRDFMNSFLLIAMVIASVLGILVAHPTINLPYFTAWTVNGQYLFPMLFVTVSCGAISGAHTMISAGTTSKQIDNEKDMKLIGFGGMLLESFLALIALITVAVLAKGASMPDGAPPVIFANAVSSFLSPMGIPVEMSYSLITLAVSSFALTTLDSITRIGRMCLQELCSPDSWMGRFVVRSFVATFITLALSACLALAGYKSIWPLLGSANQLIGSLCLFAVALFLKQTGKKSFMLALPMYSLLLVSFSALGLTIYSLITRLMAGSPDIFGDSLQLILAILLVAIGSSISKGCLLASFKRKEEL